MGFGHKVGMWRQKYYLRILERILYFVFCKFVAKKVCTGCPRRKNKIVPLNKWNKYLYNGKSGIKVNTYNYLLTPWSRVLLEKLTGSAASQEIPRIFGTRRFVTLFTSARHLSLSWANSIHSPQSPPISWRSILILSSHLRLGLPSGLFPSDFPTRTLCIPLPSPIRATCPAHLILLDFTTRKILGKEYRSLSSILCNFLHSAVTSSLVNMYNKVKKHLKHCDYPWQNTIKSFPHGLRYE